MKRRDFLHSSLFAAAVALPGLEPAWALVGTGPVADIAAVTGDGKDITLKGTDIQALAKAIKGSLLIAGEDGYDKARLVLNPSFDKHPALVAQPTSAEDIQAIVRFARANSVLVAVKCGGHSSSGQSSCDRGLQIDLSHFRGVRVDAAKKRVWVKGGTLLGQVDGECMPLGLVTPLGTVSHTGVGGLTTGGGFGRLARRFGMAIDNLASVDVVTADGSLVHADEKKNADLFWGVRGGGGNFGIVTTFEFKLHPMQKQVVAGEVAFPIDRARDLLSMWAEYAVTAPDDLYMDPAIYYPPGGKPGGAILEICYSGPAADAERVLAPIRKLGKPDKDGIRTVDYIDAQRANDSGDNRMSGSYMKSAFVSKIDAKLVDAIIDGLHPDPNRLSLLFFQHCGGAASRRPEDATAFSQRDSIANIMAVTGWRMDSGDPAPHIEATRAYWKTLEPFTRGFYVNDAPREITAKDIKDNLRGNHARLVEIKKKYDPTNLFRLNANIRPA